MSLYQELKRRNVFRVGAAYVVIAWLLIQVAETIFPLFGYDDRPARIVVVVLAIGFIPSLILAWVFELTPEGLKKDEDVDRARFVALDINKKLDRTIVVSALSPPALMAMNTPASSCGARRTTANHRTLLPA